MTFRNDKGEVVSQAKVSQWMKENYLKYLFSDGLDHGALAEDAFASLHLVSESGWTPDELYEEAYYTLPERRSLS